MIEEKVVGSRKNIEWKKKVLLRDRRIRVHRISKVYPVKGKEGRYYMFAHYERIPDFKRKKKS